MNLKEPMFHPDNHNLATVLCVIGMASVTFFFFLIVTKLISMFFL